MYENTRFIQHKVELRVNAFIRGVSSVFSEKSVPISPPVYMLVRTILGGIFVWAGASKLIAPGAFATLISAYGLVPEGILFPFAVGLSALELFAGVGLVLDVRGSLEVILGLIMLFVGVLLFGILKGLDVDCGCFSPEEALEQNTLKYAIYRDFMLLILACYLLWWRRANLRTRTL